MMRLSNSYSALYHYKVQVTTNLPGKEFTSVSIGPLAVRGNSSGYQILNNRFDTRKNKNILKIELDPSYLNRYNKEGSYFLLVNKVQSQLKESLMNQVQFEAFATDTLFFDFKEVTNKKVKVSLKKNFDFVSEYMAVEGIKLNPDTIVIEGNREIISDIDSVITEPQIRRNISENLQGVAKIKEIKGVRFSTKEVYYSQSVKRYFEAKIEVPVNMINLPKDKIVEVYPKSVELIYRGDYSSKKSFSQENFNVYVDYSKISESRGNGVKIEVGELPKGVISARLSTLFLDSYIIREAEIK